MPNKVVSTPYPLIDADPHFSRVVRYFRTSDYAAWAGASAVFPATLIAWDRVQPGAGGLKLGLRFGGALGFIGGFLFAYQRSSLRFWGWSENKREEERDLKELRERASQGLPLYGESDQPEWVQGAAYRNSAFSQLKFQAFPMLNFVNHPHHGTDPAKYGVKPEESEASE